MNKQQFLNLKKAESSSLWFAENIIGIKPYGYQKEVLEAISTGQKVAWRSGHGVGKTATAAIAVLWFLFTRPHSKVITTASAWRQVEKQLWPEIHKWRKQARWDLIGNPSYVPRKLGIELDSDWFATGEASDEPARMEGFHADYLFFVVDEAKSVPDETFESIEGALASGKETKLLLISTPPPRISGYFYEVFAKKRIGYKCFHTSCLDSPRVSRDWIEERKREWGEDSPIYQTRVLGEFAESGEDSLIPLKWIEDAVERSLEPQGRKELGVDVARFGSDKTAMVLRQGPKVLDIKVTGKEDTMQTTGRVVGMIKQYNPESVKVDSVGIGAGVVDRLLEQGYNQVVGVNVGERARNTEEFVNLRAEIYWGLRKRFEDGDIDIPDNEELIGQLANIRYNFNSRDQKIIEPKEKMKKRGLKSPDIADALALAFMKADEELPFAFA